MKFYNYPKKSLGQNFLIDKNIIRKIIEIGKLSHKNIVLEIGAGTGNLTKEILLANPKRIILIEKDEKLAARLKKKFENYKNLSVITDDVLNYINNKISYKNMVVFGNLPYNLSTKILAKLISLDKWPPWYSKLILMFQKEVADRIIAKNNSENFNRLAVLSNWRLNVKKHFDISKNCFFPKPKINSTILSFKPKRQGKSIIKDPKNLETVTRILFSNPRKMINKNLFKLFKKNSLMVNKLNIDLKKRPRELSCDMYYEIASKYEKLFE